MRVVAVWRLFEGAAEVSQRGLDVASVQRHRGGVNRFGGCLRPGGSTRSFAFADLEIKLGPFHELSLARIALDYTPKTICRGLEIMAL